MHLQFSRMAALHQVYGWTPRALGPLIYSNLHEDLTCSLGGNLGDHPAVRPGFNGLPYAATPSLVATIPGEFQREFAESRGDLGSDFVGTVDAPLAAMKKSMIAPTPMMTDTTRVALLKIAANELNGARVEAAFPAIRSDTMINARTRDFLDIDGLGTEIILLCVSVACWSRVSLASYLGQLYDGDESWASFARYGRLATKFSDRTSATPGARERTALAHKAVVRARDLALYRSCSRALHASAATKCLVSHASPSVVQKGDRYIDCEDRDPSLGGTIGCVLFCRSRSITESIFFRTASTSASISRYASSSPA